MFKLFKKKERVECGGKVEYYVKGLKDEIKSNNIVKFDYSCEYLRLLAELIDNKLHIEIRRGSHKDFSNNEILVDYSKKDTKFLKELNDFIIDHNLSRDNGHVYKISGLIPYLEEELEVIYDTEEKIYKMTNRNFVLGDDEVRSLIDLFISKANNDGYKITRDDLHFKD